MGLKLLAKRGLGLLGRMGKKKPIPKAPSRPKTAKEKHDEFMNMDPYARGTIISRRESAKRGDVWTGTSIVGTPGPHRTAKAIKKYHGPHSYQLTDPKRKGKAKGGRIDFKKGKAVTKADLAKRDLWRKRILKKRSKIGQRKSKWDVQGAISGHPLNPFRIHAAGKATDWTKMYKDTYGRTRDELKKSRDPNVKKVAEGFQEMDYKDKARSHPYYKKGTKYYEEHSPKLTKRIHGRLGKKTGGPIPPIDLPWPKPGEVPTKKRKRRAEGGRIGLQRGGGSAPFLRGRQFRKAGIK